MDPVEIAKDQASAALTDAGGRLDAEIQSLREDVARIAESLTGAARPHAPSARAWSGDGPNDAAADGRGELTLSTLGRMIDRNPFAAITTALLAGLLVGMLARSRR